MDVDQLKTLSQVEAAVTEHKDTLCRKVKHLEQTKEQKKDSNKSFNEVIKTIQEEVNFELETLDKLANKMRELNG